jgi:hypothetical protein
VVPPDRCAFSSIRKYTGVLTGSSTFEPLVKKHRIHQALRAIGYSTPKDVLAGRQ